MVLNTKTPRTGEEISNGRLNPAWTSRLQAELGASEEFLVIGRSNLAAEIDANSLRVRINELDNIIQIAQRQGDPTIYNFCFARRSELHEQLDALIKGGTPAAPVQQVAPSRVTPVAIRRVHTQDFQTIAAIKLVRSYADDRIGLKEAKDLIEAVNAATPEWPAGLTPLRVRHVDEFSQEMGAIGYQVKAVPAVEAPTPPAEGIYDVRIRWMEYSGKRRKMEEALIEHTSLEADEKTCGSIHDGGEGGSGAEFRQIRIRDFETFRSKMQDYGYAVELLAAPVAAAQAEVSPLYDIRIAWVKWTGNGELLRKAIEQHLGVGVTHAQQMYDAVHAKGWLDRHGNVTGDAFADFHGVRIDDYRTFAKKVSEAGYEVSDISPVVQEASVSDNPFIVRPPV